MYSMTLVGTNQVRRGRNYVEDRLPGRLSAMGTLCEQGEQDQDSDEQAGCKGLKATSREEVGVGGGA